MHNVVVRQTNLCSVYFCREFKNHNVIISTWETVKKIRSGCGKYFEIE